MGFFFFKPSILRNDTKHKIVYTFMAMVPDTSTQCLFLEYCDGFDLSCAMSEE